MSVCDVPWQSTTLVDAMKGVNVFLGHSKHAVWPGSDWYVPLGHGKHGFRPDEDTYPGSQGSVNISVINFPK